jgi:DNA-binding PadR family transcriptional regulator
VTHGEIIILRLLAGKDMYGYELDHIIEENYMRQWADIGFSSIYNILNKLERKAFVGSYYVKESGSPRRKVYRISDEGRTALHGEVARMLAQPGEWHDDFGVALVTSDVLTDEEFRQALTAYREQLVQKLDLYRTAIPERSRRKERVALALERFIRLVESEIRWIDER